MKKILKNIFFLLLFFANILGAFANTELEVSISKSQISLSESLSYSIIIQGENISGNINPTINGIENFEIFSRQSGLSFQSINGETMGNLELILQLKPKKEGVFSLGPVELSLGNEIVQNDTIYEIQVGDQRTSLQNGQIGSGTSSFLQEEENQTLPKLKGLQKEKKSSYFLWILLSVFFLVFFLFLVYLLKNKKYPVNGNNINKDEVQENISVNTSLREKYFGDLTGDLGSHIFAEQYLTGARKYFYDQGLRNAEHMTLSELNLEEIFQNSPLKNDFESCYYTLYTETYNLEIKQKKTIVQHLTTL